MRVRFSGDGLRSVALLIPILLLVVTPVITAQKTEASPARALLLILQGCGSEITLAHATPLPYPWQPSEVEQGSHRIRLLDAAGRELQTVPCTLPKAGARAVSVCQGLGHHEHNEHQKHADRSKIPPPSPILSSVRIPDLAAVSELRLEVRIGESKVQKKTEAQGSRTRGAQISVAKPQAGTWRAILWFSRSTLQRQLAVGTHARSNVVYTKATRASLERDAAALKARKAAKNSIATDPRPAKRKEDSR